MASSRAGQDPERSLELSPWGDVQRSSGGPGDIRRPVAESGPNMACPGGAVSDSVQALTCELELDGEVQSQLWINAKRERVGQLERELRISLENNRGTEELNSRLVGKISMLKENYERIVKGLRGSGTKWRGTSHNVS